MTVLHTLLRRVLGSPVLWRLRGSSPPPPPTFKHNLLWPVAQEHGLRVLVETGTYRGDTVAALLDRFDQIISVELSEELARKAQQRFEREGKVTILQGNSPDVLRPLLHDLGPTLFWLDAHYSSGTTARGVTDTPVVAELDLVLPHAGVVLIDDARLFGSDPSYPTLDRVAEIAASAGRRTTVRDDVIRIV